MESACTATRLNPSPHLPWLAMPFSSPTQPHPFPRTPPPREGAISDCIYLLARGSMVETTVKGNFQDHQVEAPAILGQSAVLNKLDEESVWPVTVRAETLCVLWRLSLDDLEEVEEISPGISEVRGWGFGWPG